MQIALGMLYGPPSYATLKGHDVAKPIVEPDKIPKDKDCMVWHVWKIVVLFSAINIAIEPY